MKGIITLLGLLSLVQITAADVLIYRPKIAVTLTGNGAVSKSAIRGYLVLDPNSLNYAEVFQNPASKTFFVRFPTNSQVTQINGGLHSFTVIEQPATGTGGFEAKGINFSISTATNSYTAPKVFSESGFDLNGGMIEEEKGALTYDGKTTHAQNAIDGDLSATVERLRQLLISAGNTEN